MADNLPARVYHTQQTHFMRALVNYNTPNIGTTGKVPLGTLPNGAIVVGLILKVATAFNAATTNVLTVGDGTTADSVLGATDVDETVVQTTDAFAGIGYQPTADTPLFIKYAQTGTAASAGQATVILLYVPNTDL